MKSIIFAFIALFGWTFGDIFSTIACRKLGAYSSIVWSLLISLFFATLYIPFVITDLQHITLPILVITIIIGLVLLIGGVAFNESTISQNPSLVVAISSSFIAIVVILSVLFLKDPLSIMQISSIFVIFLGVILSTCNFTNILTGTLFDKGVLYALVAGICWGVGYTFIQIPIKSIGWFWPIYISMLLFPLIILVMKIKKIPLQIPYTKNNLGILLLYSLCTTAAEYCYNIALSGKSSAIIAPIAGSYPALFGISAFFIFKDKITRQQLLGTIVTLLGIIFLSMVNS